MHTTTNQPGGSVLASLRALAPAHPMTLDEALRLAEGQAALLLELCDATAVPVPSSIVTNQPRITVEHDQDLPTHAASGCSDWDSRRRTWVISLNPTEPRQRQRFTVLHEYKHILDHPGPSIRPSRYAYQRPAAEIVADYFAGCVLIPKRPLAAAYYDGIQKSADLAQLFDVSKEAIQVRLTQIGLAEPQLIGRRRPAIPARRARYFRTATQPVELAV
jgi:uncharacterized protein DUF955